MTMFLRLVTAIAIACFATGAWAQDNCPYSQAYQHLRSTLDGLSTKDAAKALQAFAARNLSPLSCEATSLDEALDEREKLLVTLTSIGGSERPAQAIFRCYVFNAKTAQCQSPMEDGTAHANLKETSVLPQIEKNAFFEIKSQLSSAKPHAVYLATLAQTLDGKPLKRLPARGAIKGSALVPNTVLIAIYKSDRSTGSSLYPPYRKAVWYF
jgi:hypothetical protein